VQGDSNQLVELFTNAVMMQWMGSDRDAAVFWPSARHFQITSIEYAGSLNGEANYEISLASAGQLTFVAL
jgi:predicted secreted protein